jgi:tetraacyldisaccharide 4'-kinase
MKSPSPPVTPWQLLYGGAHSLRRRWYHTRSRHLPRPVVSVGNLHWGGTGKTPLTASLAAYLRDRGLTTPLQDRGLAVCILSRGYASRGRGVRVVSTGEGPLLGPLVAGDEPVLLAGELPGVAVVVGPDRHHAGLHALRRLPRTPQLFLLDDGFSHLALHRDLDLVAFPAADPFGGGRLPPSGRLREPLAAIARAHGVLLTGASSEEDGERLAAALRPFGFQGPGFASFTRPGAPRWLSGSGLGEGEIPAGARLFLVSAIARPDGFLQAVRELGLEVAGELRFPDHHRYPLASLDRIADEFRAAGADAVLTTAKDAVKLLGRLALPVAVLPIRAEPEPRFWNWLDGEVERIGERERFAGAS